MSERNELLAILNYWGKWSLGYEVGPRDFEGIKTPLVG